MSVAVKQPLDGNVRAAINERLAERPTSFATRWRRATTAMLAGRQLTDRSARYPRTWSASRSSRTRRTQRTTRRRTARTSSAGSSDGPPGRAGAGRPRSAGTGGAR